MIVVLRIAFGWFVLTVFFVLYRLLCAMDSEIAHILRTRARKRTDDDRRARS